VTLDDEHERGRASTRQRSSTDPERRRASLYVAQHGTSVEDRRELLLALGLLEPGFRWTAAGPHGPRKKVTDAE
jgi:hypothetical protein